MLNSVAKNWSRTDKHNVMNASYLEYLLSIISNKNMQKKTLYRPRYYLFELINEKKEGCMRNKFRETRTYA